MTFKTLPVLAMAAFLQGVSAVADEAIGSYLAARQASIQNDYSAAAEYFTRALTRDPSNPAILESAVVAHVSLGQFDRAIPISRKIEADDLLSQVAHIVLAADEIKRGAYDEVMSRIERDRGIGALADGLIAAWVDLGRGDMSSALERFDGVAEERGLRSFAIYHKALALASVGDYETAEKIFAGKSDGPLQRTRRGTIAWAEVLSQLERNEEAVALLDEAFGGDLDPEIAELRARLVADEQVKFSLVSGAQDGIAEVFYSLGRALLAETSEDYVLLYSRAAEYLKPDHIDAIVMSAELLESLERY